MDPPSLARGEHDENVHRKDLLLTEFVAIRRALEPAERQAPRRGGELG